MAKNIINQEATRTITSGATATYEDYTLAAQTIKFNVVGETIVSNWSIRGVASTDLGVIPWIRFTKVGKLVTMNIPAFIGTKSGGGSNVLTIITAGDLPSRFLPSDTAYYCVDAWSGGNYLSVGQDSAILNCYSSGAVEIVFTTKNMGATSVGIRRDVCVSWLQD